ncbi:MAG: ATP-binding protein, partial [Proteobacteria bacterium]
GARIELAVEDDGAGLDAAQRERARTRGARLDEEAPGTGLGLAIVEEVAAAHGGRLALGVASLGGLRAAVDLPAAR